VIIEEKSEEGTSWTVSEKTYYFYNEDNVDDIALISTGEPNPRPDIVGESINLKVLLENKNYLNVYQNVNITALIEDTQGNQIATFTETIDQIYLGVSMLYTFPQNYTVPNDSVYFITVYIDSYDNNKLNDTLHLKRLTHNEVADIELISIETPSATTKGVIGESINVKVLLENKSILNVYRNVYIRVLIEGAQGNQITTFSEIIGQINVGVSMRYTFSQDYIVPNDSVYYITVYIDSYDNNKLNDTLHLTHYTTPLNDIKTIDNSTVHISQNFPNPADNQTLITYSIPTAGQATFSVYSINGQLLSSQSVKANTGENTLVLNTDKLAAGIYFYAFEFNGQRIVKKMNVSR
jgi:hypothetical protein